MQTVFSNFLPEKMSASIDGTQAVYTLNSVSMNSLVGLPIKITISSDTQCVHCGVRNVELNDGFCAHCDEHLAERDICKVKPELCHKDDAQHPCRDAAWAAINCSDQVVYLSNTSGGGKVGITRLKNVHSGSRWCDQGATQALVISNVPSRLSAGLLEVALTEFIDDKTQWRAMLTAKAEPVDLVAMAEKFIPLIQDKIALYGATVAPLQMSAAKEINYPIQRYPRKIGNPINADKTPEFSGTLIGIKGQYLMIGDLNGDTEKDGVINLRKYAGRHITIEAMV